MNEIKTTSQLDTNWLKQQLGTQFLGQGKRLIYLPEVGSTNTLAMQLAQDGSEEGVVVLTDSQTAGKGRQGRHWIDFTGCNAISSTVLRPLFSPYLLVMIASIAVIDAITEHCKVIATIKWPNDILIGSRKVAGILIETSHDRSRRMIAIMGIGVNLNQPHTHNKQEIAPEEAALSEIATTLEGECGHPIHRENFIAALLRNIETNYLALQQEVLHPIAAEYRTSAETSSRLLPKM